ncbi:hypothetical protein [Sphingomonas sp. C3-2]|uniref:hypothetical protein n=1 Tax=Sphingomonas sp. C3-2 TaxID=3062169 RepID=UPI00294AFF38|nr:hypothetical protein [Sphingomonas sp. C3-2]WOK37181.1 hypothetical protein QYC26_03020 [Sphingomonas sp. C3-2]
MSEEGLVLAIERLERALSRVEAAADRPAPVTDNNGAHAAEEALLSLQHRHDHLKQQVDNVIGALDRLIEKG